MRLRLEGRRDELRARLPEVLRAVAALAGEHLHKGDDGPRPAIFPALTEMEEAGREVVSRILARAEKKIMETLGVGSDA